MKKNKKNLNQYDPLKRIWRIFFIAFLLIVIFWASLSLQHKFFSALPVIESHIQAYPILYIIVFLILAIFSAMLSPFSSLPLVPFAVFTWGKLFTAILLLAGWVIGAVTAYSLARYVGRPELERFISFKKIDYYQKLIPKKLEFWFLLLFRLATPVEIPSYIFGFTKVSFWKYFMATILGEVHIAVFAVYGSDALLEKKFGDLILWVSAAVLVLLITVYWLYRTINYKINSK